VAWILIVEGGTNGYDCITKRLMLGIRFEGQSFQRHRKTLNHGTLKYSFIDLYGDRRWNQGVGKSELQELQANKVYLTYFIVVLTGRQLKPEIPYLLMSLTKPGFLAFPSVNFP
jgi:hypothetical protein